MIRKILPAVALIFLALCVSFIPACSDDNFGMTDLEGKWLMNAEALEHMDIPAPDRQRYKKSGIGFHIDIGANLIHIVEGDNIGGTAPMSFISSRGNSFTYQVMTKKTEFTLLDKNRLRITPEGKPAMVLERKK